MSVPLPPESNWKQVRMSDEVKKPVRQVARSRGSEWMSASNDNYMSVDGEATLILKVA